MMQSGAKTALFSILGVLLWIDSNLGVAFYVLMCAFVANFALHYNDKQEFIQRMTLYLGSTFFSYYLQNTTTFMSIPLLQGLIIAMAAHESLEVIIEAKSKLDAYKVKHPKDAPQIDQIESALAQIQSLVPVLLEAKNNTAQKPVVPEEPQP